MFRELSEYCLFAHQGTVNMERFALHQQKGLAQFEGVALRGLAAAVEFRVDREQPNVGLSRTQAYLASILLAPLTRDIERLVAKPQPILDAKAANCWACRGGQLAQHIILRWQQGGHETMMFDQPPCGNNTSSHPNNA